MMKFINITGSIVIIASFLLGLSFLRPLVEPQPAFNYQEVKISELEQIARLIVGIIGGISAVATLTLIMVNTFFFGKKPKSN